MDNNRTPENIQPSGRIRKDSMTPEQRRSMQQGFPTRQNASTTPPPSPNRRPLNDGTLPQYMRRGEVPLRSKQTTSAKHSDTVTPTRSPAANRAISSGIPTRSTRRIAEDAAENTLILDRTQLNRLTSRDKSVDSAAVTTVMERPLNNGASEKAIPKDSGTESAKKETPSAKQIPFFTFFSRITNTHKNVLTILSSAAVLLIVCILLPLSLSAKQNLKSDFDMSAGAMDDATILEALTDVQIKEIQDQAVTEKFQVTLHFFDQESISVSTAPITLSNLLEKIGYSVRENDRFPCSFETQLTEEIVLQVDTVTYQTVDEFVSIPYESEVIEVQTVPKGTKKITQNGQDGAKKLTYSVEIVNGQEIGRTLINEVIETQPVNEIASLGIGGSFVGNDGKTYNYSYYRVVNATYYNLEGPTYLGYNADESVIAVDPNYIPLGTKVYVKNDKYDFGVRIAADTGSMIKEWEVDIWIGADNPQLPAFAYTGYHYDMRIYYLE